MTVNKADFHVNIVHDKKFNLSHEFVHMFTGLFTGLFTQKSFIHKGYCTNVNNVNKKSI